MPTKTRPARIPRGAGGYFTALNPQLGATETQIFWQPELLPTSVVLGETPWQPAARRIGPALLPAAIAKFHDAKGIHLILPNHVQVSLLGQDPARSRALVIPPDETMPARLAGAERFRRTLAGKPAGPLPPSQRLTPRHRRRLIQMLKALDGKLSDATYREIAAVLFGANAAHERGWKTAPVRAQTIRLVNDSVKMANRGYLKFLRGR